MKMHKIQYKSTDEFHGSGRLIVDGIDISKYAQEVTFSMKPASIPLVIVRLTGDIEIDIDGVIHQKVGKPQE